jgi:hypothetical protein
MSINVLDSLCQQFEKIAVKGKLSRANKYGVEVLHDRTDPMNVLMRFVNQDNRLVSVEICMESLSREYIAELFMTLKSKLDTDRADCQRGALIDVAPAYMPTNH